MVFGPEVDNEGLWTVGAATLGAQKNTKTEFRILQTMFIGISFVMGLKTGMKEPCVAYGISGGSRYNYCFNNPTPVFSMALLSFLTAPKHTYFECFGGPMSRLRERRCA